MEIPSKKLLLLLVAVLIAAAVVGAVLERELKRSEEFRPQTASTPTGAGILLDNRGGFSHAGRRVLLRPDGSYADTRYTDVVGDEHKQSGRYIFAAERTHVILIPERGTAEDLFRADFEGIEYWVAPADREHVPKPDGFQLRQISLRFILDGEPEK